MEAFVPCDFLHHPHDLELKYLSPPGGVLRVLFPAIPPHRLVCSRIFAILDTKPTRTRLKRAFPITQTGQDLLVPRSLLECRRLRGCLRLQAVVTDQRRSTRIPPVLETLMGFPIGGKLCEAIFPSSPPSHQSCDAIGCLSMLRLALLLVFQEFLGFIA